MNKFRIQDLVISLQSGWCKATPEKAYPEPVAGMAPAPTPAGHGGVVCNVTAVACGGGTQGTGVVMDPTCTGTRAYAVPGGVDTADSLRILKRQLQEALEDVKQREAAVLKAIPEPETAEEIDAVIEKLEEAVEELRQKRQKLNP